MAMTIEKFGIKLAAIYRPLNNHLFKYFNGKNKKKIIFANIKLKKELGGLREIIKLNQKWLFHSFND